MIGRLFLFFTLILPLIGVAQLENHAIGIRAQLGINSANLDLSYQLKLNDKSRADIGLGISEQYANTATILYGNFSVYYQRVHNLTAGLNFYYGIGGHYRYRISAGIFSSGFKQNIGGLSALLGLEYNFNALNVPLVFAVDYNPLFFLGSFTNFESIGTFHPAVFGVSLRYTFDYFSLTDN